MSARLSSSILEVMSERVSIGGRRHKVLEVEDVRAEVDKRGYEAGSKGLHGACLLKQKTVEILISSKLSDRQKASTLLHEVIHSILPDLPEEQVLRLERELFPFVWNRGFRNKKSP